MVDHVDKETGIARSRNVPVVRWASMAILAQFGAALHDTKTRDLVELRDFPSKALPSTT